MRSDIVWSPYATLLSLYLVTADDTARAAVHRAVRIQEVRGDQPGVRFTVRVQPRASRTEVVGTYGDAVKIRLAAPPVEGAANSALVNFLARCLGVPKSAVAIAVGARRRTKTVEVSGVRPDEVRTALELR